MEANPGRRDISRGPDLSSFLEGYYRSRKGEVAEGTLELHQQTGRYLIGFFGETRRLDTITRAEARAFRTALAAGELARVNGRPRKKPPAQTTVDRHIREAKVVFGVALKDGQITLNPFDQLGAAKAVLKEWHYVDEAEFDKLMGAARPAWKLLLGLARWAGLRAEEALQLPWL